MKYVKHSILLVAYFLAYQIGLGFLMAGLSLDAVPDLPAQMMDMVVWTTAIIGCVLLTALTIVLWKVLYPRKSVDYRVDSTWFHKLQWPILLYLAFFVLQLLLPMPESQNQKTVEVFVHSYPTIAFFAVVIFAPILEELIFRGLLATYFFSKIPNLKTAGVYLLLTGTLFSFIHSPATISQFLIYFIMGINLGWLYLLKRDIRYPIALHLVNNLLSFALMFLG